MVRRREGEGGEREGFETEAMGRDVGKRVTEQEREERGRRGHLLRVLRCDVIRRRV